MTRFKIDSFFCINIFSFEELRQSKQIFNPSSSTSFYDDDDGTLKSIREGNHTLLTLQTCVYTHIQSCDVAAAVVVVVATVVVANVVVVIESQDNINYVRRQMYFKDLESKNLGNINMIVKI